MFHLGDFSGTIPEIGLETYFSTVSAWSPLMLYSLYSIRWHSPLSFHLSLVCDFVSLPIYLWRTLFYGQGNNVFVVVSLIHVQWIFL